MIAKKTTGGAAITITSVTAKNHTNRNESKQKNNHNTKQDKENNIKNPKAATRPIAKLNILPQHHGLSHTPNNNTKTPLASLPSSITST